MLSEQLRSGWVLHIAQALLFVAFLFTQLVANRQLVSWHQTLPSAPSVGDVQLWSLGESAVAAKILGFWLLSFDTRAGKIIPYDSLDYDRLTAWLELIQDLDLHSDAASVAAGGVFIEAKDKAKVRQMIELVYRQFRKAPAINWRWLAYATVQAKYRLKDLPLALEMARDLHLHSADADIPAWARDLEILILQDLGEFEAAIALTTALLKQGAILDADELRFLNTKLRQLQQQKLNQP